MDVLSICLSAPYACLIPEEARDDIDPLELKMVVSHYVGSGSQTQVL